MKGGRIHMKPYQGILAFISYCVLQLIVSGLISLENYEVISGIIALVAFGWLLHKKRMLHMSSRDLKGSQLFFCLGIGLGLALISKIAIVLGVLSQEPVPEQTTVTLFYWIQYMATRIVLIPVVEELLFRGILFGSFASSFSYKIAMVLSAAIFALLHLTISWPSVFLIGILLAWIYWRTDNLAVTMVIHGTINLGTFLSMPILTLLAANRTLGIMAGLLMVLLGIGITCLSTKMFLKKHDALPA